MIIPWMITSIIHDFPHCSWLLIFSQRFSLGLEFVSWEFPNDQRVKSLQSSRSQVPIWQWPAPWLPNQVPLDVPIVGGDECLNEGLGTDGGICSRYVCVCA
jgi:hypothetical protein